MKCSHVPWRALGALLALAGLAVACGGVDSGGTGQTVQTSSTGRVSGFGSVIVNGVRFDDAGASVVDDAGMPRNRSELRLGMVVQIEGQLHGNSGNGVANRIQFGNEIAGPVESVDLAASQLVVLGQLVRVDADTLYEGLPAGLADLQAGQFAEVFGFYDTASGSYTATRIERKSSLAQFKLRGLISALAPADKRFFIGTAEVDYAGVPTPSLPTLANGLVVRVTLSTTPVAGRWSALTVHTSQRYIPENNEAELEGFVGDFAGASNFTVAGVPVDASGPTVRVRHGSLADLADGVRVEVEGFMRGGILVASQLDFKRGGDQGFELHGPIESVDPVARTLVLRGVTVAWDDDTVFAAGTAAGLLAGVSIEARGSPAGGGVRILADAIRFER